MTIRTGPSARDLGPGRARMVLPIEPEDFDPTATEALDRIAEDEPEIYVNAWLEDCE